ncbi:hypothetical protein [uncultured Rikenella sp.]|uniref:hypothetical protein n=1 Tax=uncultured Rikenella sp. TaxID=368003 RepID=UPI0025FAB63B|nr:hypothetical protein [uncultured Rikenella sp.]
MRGRAKLTFRCGSLYPNSLFARLGDSFYFGLSPKQLDRLIKAAARGLVNAFLSRPLGFHLDFARRKTSEIPLLAGGRLSSFEPDGTAAF